MAAWAQPCDAEFASVDGALIDPSQRRFGALCWGAMPNLSPSLSAIRLASAALVLLALAACAGPRIERDLAAEPAVAACIEGYRLIDGAVEAAGVRDAEASRVASFPYLRASRFLASWRERELSDAGFEAWVDRLAELDRAGRTIELANLPADERRSLDAAIAERVEPGRDAEQIVENCPPILRAQDFCLSEERRQLQAAVAVPDDYSVLQRTVGIYPLTAIPVAMGYERWKDRNLATFERSVAALDWQGRPTVYRAEGERPPLKAAEVAAMLRAARENPLKVPDLRGEQLMRLAETFAPDFVVDVASDVDRIGHPVWLAGGVPSVDPGDPVAFVRLDHAWLDGEVVAQLVYQIWFAARPRIGTFDLLGGALDGLVWRVTLGADDGRALVYDTIHPCGCYHFFFPAADVVRKAQPQDEATDVRETIEVPRVAPTLERDERMTVALASGSHYVAGLAASSEIGRAWPERRYRLAIDPVIPDAALRSLPDPEGGRRSLYGPNGLVAGSERRERWLLWPMGIASPGAMRQWGRHATAFVGRRHFDDPYLIDGAFER